MNQSITSKNVIILKFLKQFVSFVLNIRFSEDFITVEVVFRNFFTTYVCSFTYEIKSLSTI